MVLSDSLVLDLILTLDMDTESVSYTTLQLCWLVLHYKGVLRLVKEDRKCIVSWISVRKIVGKEAGV